MHSKGVYRIASRIHGITGDCRGLHEIAKHYMGLRRIVTAYIRLHVIESDQKIVTYCILKYCMGLHGDCIGLRSIASRLDGVTGDCISWQNVTWDCKGL